MYLHLLPLLCFLFLSSVENRDVLYDGRSNFDRTCEESRKRKLINISVTEWPFLDGLI